MSLDSFVVPPNDIVWIEPWDAADASADILVAELRRELSEGHMLFSVPVVAVARRIDCDDVLFAIADASKSLVVVHLAWSGRSEPDPLWPHTTVYEGWQDWISRCQMPDHKSWLAQG